MMKRNSLTDMEYDEVSLVALGANQLADIVIYKSGKACSCDNYTGSDNGACEKCGGMVKKTDATPRGDANVTDHAKSVITLAKAKMTLAQFKS